MFGTRFLVWSSLMVALLLLVVMVGQLGTAV